MSKTDFEKLLEEHIEQRAEEKTKHRFDELENKLKYISKLVASTIETRLDMIERSKRDNLTANTLMLEGEFTGLVQLASDLNIYVFCGEDFEEYAVKVDGIEID